ncbi:MAG: MECDP-synthase, partial [Pseudomonadota bacterium]|nr:MECDP-synthase [Pseudomonadota bacterium]
MFKKTLISLAVASSVGLTGCFGGGESGANANPDYRISNPAIDGKVWPRFNPVKGELPIPNDLIFQSDDLETVNVNEADGTFSVADSTPPVTSALNKLSGASTVAPIDIAMSGTIDASSVDGQPFLV